MPANQSSYTSHQFAKEIFLRGLGLVFLIAFASYAWQIEVLYSERGILSIAGYMERLLAHFGERNFSQYPSLSWWNSSSSFLWIQCLLGLIFSILLILRKIPLIALLASWFLYLSLMTAGQVFYHFQWDILLLETALLSVFAFIGFRNRNSNLWGLFLLWFLLFKLMFLSGMVKIWSGDLSWRDGSAMTFHYFTQPLPNLFSYYFHQLPLWLHKVSCWIMFAIELILPFFILIGAVLKFEKRLSRIGVYLHRIAATGIITLMAIIFVSGNYNFFNILVALLAVTLLDDNVFAKKNERASDDLPLYLKGLSFTVFIFVSVLGSYQFHRECYGQKVGEENLLSKTSEFIAPFKSLNSYGLFRVMTTTRPEIVFEGSDDGLEWKEYSFYWKISELDRRPYQAAPYHPRLDWQLWFAALGNIDYNPWVYQIIRQMLEGSGLMEAYISKNPFPENPPKFIRTRLFDYEFEYENDDNWWKRMYVRDYTRPLQLSDYN